MGSDANARVFVSYAHEDAAWHAALIEQRIESPTGLVPVWSDGRIGAGDDWFGAIRDALDAATVAVLLVSRHFLRSEFIAREELPTVLKRRRSDGLTLLWVPVGDLDGADLGALRDIQALCATSEPLPARPPSLPGAARDAERALRQRIEAAIDPIGVPLMRSLEARYEPFTLLGRSDVAVVYRTRDRHLDRPAVIKAPVDPDGANEFARNVRDAACVADEPHFVNLYEAVLTQQRPYCVMQYIEGQNLRTWLEQDNRRPLATIVRLLAKIAEGLDAAQALGGGYGNLKPSNVVLSRRGEPYLLPMGRRVAECRGACALDELERRSPDAEELAYLAPEQFDEEADGATAEKSDQYMLGLLAWQMLAGTLPPTIGGAAPTDATRADCLATIRERRGEAFGELPPVCARRPDCSEALAKIVRRMTARSPADRFDSLAQVRAVLASQLDVMLPCVRESYARCLAEQQASGRNYFEAVYRGFFEREPSAQSKFTRLGAPQYEILETALVRLFAFYEQERGDEPNEPNVLSQMATAHDRRHRDIGTHFYAPFRDALVDAACGGAEPATAFDPRCRFDAASRARIRRAWQAVLAPGIAYMRSRY